MTCFTELKKKKKMMVPPPFPVSEFFPDEIFFDNHFQAFYSFSLKIMRFTWTLKEWWNSFSIHSWIYLYSFPSHSGQIFINLSFLVVHICVKWYCFEINYQNSWKYQNLALYILIQICTKLSQYTHSYMYTFWFASTYRYKHCRTYYSHRLLFV